MNFDHCKRYWEPAALNLYHLELREPIAEVQLERALGCLMYTEYVVRSAKHDCPLSEELIALLQKLAGPHGRTILRAYQIKHGIKHDQAGAGLLADNSSADENTSEASA